MTHLLWRNDQVQPSQLEVLSLEPIGEMDRPRQGQPFMMTHGLIAVDKLTLVAIDSS